MSRLGWFNTFVYLRQNWRDFLCTMQHWFQYILFVSLGPGADWQLSDFYSFVVNNFHITLHKELVSINLGNGTSEVLVRGYLQVEGKKMQKLAIYHLCTLYEKLAHWLPHQLKPALRSTDPGFTCDTIISTKKCKTQKCHETWKWKNYMYCSRKLPTSTNCFSLLWISNLIERFLETLAIKASPVEC